MASFMDVCSGGWVIMTGYLKGLLHGSNVFGAMKILCSNRDLFLGTLKCVGANMFLIVGSDTLLTRFILPLIRDYGMWIYDIDHPKVHDSAAGSTIDEIIVLPVWVEYLASGIYYSTWLFPIWILIYLAVNIPTYAELASISFSHYKPTVQSDVKSKVSSKKSSSLEEEIYRFIFFFFLILQKYALQALPNILFIGAIGRFFSFVFSMLICSLSAFEYTWHQQGVAVSKRHAYIEQAWPYFLGFGTPATVLTFFFPLFISLGLTACFFPFLLFLAMGGSEAADNQVKVCSSSIPSLPMFKLTRDVTETVASSLVSLILGKKSDFMTKLREGRPNRTPITTTTVNATVTATTTVVGASPPSSTKVSTRKLASPPSHLKDDISRVRSLSQT